MAAARSHPTITPEWLEEENYFFALSKYTDILLHAPGGASGFRHSGSLAAGDDGAARKRAARFLGFAAGAARTPSRGACRCPAIRIMCSTSGSMH